MSKATKAEEEVLALVDKYLASCKEPPPTIHISQKQAAAVRGSRKRHKEPRHTTEYLEFTRYKGIPVAILEEESND